MSQASRQAAGPLPEIDDPIVPRWLPLASLALAVAGLGVSIYLTIEHFTASTTLACPDTGTLNCLKVTTSEQSKFLGMPVAVLGLVYFAVMVVLSLPALWASARPEVRLGRLGFTAVGVLFVGYLVYAELFTLNAICLWCTVAHVLAAGLFALAAVGTAYADPADLKKAARS